MRPDRPDRQQPEEPLRRSVVPTRAARSLWPAAAWTGAGTAVVAAVVAVAAVAVSWLPASGADGNANSALRAGLLTFLASVHGGITVDGLAADFVPLGMTLALAALAWRAGAALADVADDLDEWQPGRLVGAALLQAAAFAVTCAVAGRLATLGTSSVPAFGVTIAAFGLFLLSGGVAFVRYTPLAEDVRAALPVWAAPAGRVAIGVLAVYLAAGAVLAAGSLVLHHGRVETLSAQVGGGWSGVPVLALGALAAPNAVMAGASYLAGPGFAVGAGNGVSLGSGGHGLLPAFPILGGVPSGPGGAAAWTLAALTFLLAGGCAAALVSRGARSWSTRFADLARGGVLAAVSGGVLAWQAGGSIGSGRLSAVGASPWQVGLAFAGLTVVAGSLGLGLLALVAVQRRRTTARSAASGRSALQVLAERATAVADRVDERLEATHTVVELPDAQDEQRGFLRATLSSVANAVTTTEDEKAAG